MTLWWTARPAVAATHVVCRVPARAGHLMQAVRLFAVAACAFAWPGSPQAWAGSYSFQFVAFPGATSTYVQGLNDWGAVVGDFDDAAGASHGFWEIAGHYATIDPAGLHNTYLAGINGRGLAVGIAQRADGSTVLFTHDTKTGKETSLSPPPGLSFFSAAINAAGVITGSLQEPNGNQVAFLKNAGGLRVIRRPPGTRGGYYAVAINSRAEVVGNSFRPDGTKGSFVFRAGVSTVLNVPGFTDTTLNFITDTGVFGGAALDTTPSQHAFTVRGGKVTFEKYPGSDWDDAQGVTAAGNVIGNVLLGGRSNGYVLSGGAYHTLVIPFLPNWSMYIVAVNASGSMIGTALSPTGKSDISFIGVCRRDQIPCTQ